MTTRAKAGSRILEAVHEAASALHAAGFTWTHCLDNLRQRSPFPIVANVGDMLRRYELIERRADSPAHIGARHDPLTCTLFQPADPGAR